MRGSQVVSGGRRSGCGRTVGREALLAVILLRARLALIDAKDPGIASIQVRHGLPFNQKSGVIGA
jgi:hypothetical protein